MSDKLIKGDLGAELRRLESTNFFRDKPEGQPKSSYLYDVAMRQASRFGVGDYLASHYIRMSAFARKVGV